jgi:uncharacterized protein YfaS (alpha-2-macroglobulin family)
LLDKLLGDDARVPFAELERRVVAGDDGMLHWKSSERDDYGDWNDKMATAVGLQAMLAVDKNDPRIGSVLLWLMTRRTGEYWGNTRDTAWVLAALCDYLGSQPAAARPSGEVRVRLNGKLLKTYTLAPDLSGEPESVLRVPWSALRSSGNNLTLERSGGGSPVFYSVQLRQTVGMEEIPALSTSNIGVQREYLRVLPRQAGQDRWTLQTEPTNNSLRQGDRVRVRLTLNVPRDMSYVLVEDPFPSGCEVTERGSADETVEWGYWYSSVDVRDDRIAFFARRLTKGKHTIEYNLRAQTPGSYRALPALLQPMYAPAVRAESAEATVVVQ